jgi:hypothetical protein
MRLCIVGIGGCGGHLAERFLRNQDVTLLKKSLGEHVSFGGVKGLWLEADVVETEDQSFFGSLERGFYPGFFIPHDVIGDKSKTHMKFKERYGYDLKKQGFMRQAEFLKAVFEIFETDEDIKKEALSEYPSYPSNNPILEAAWDQIRPYTTLSDIKDNNGGSKMCDGILFIVSLGGGTGTGFVNPITRYIRSKYGAYPVFVLGVLTEEGVDPQQRASEEKRDLGATISLYDLIAVTKNGKINKDVVEETGSSAASGENASNEEQKDEEVYPGVDGVILIDNQIMVEKFGPKNYSAIDDYIHQAMRPFVAGRHYPGEDPGSLPMREKFLEGLNHPPILVPCYHREKRRKDPEEDLVRRALSDGRLFGCDPRMAERAYVFTRGFMKLDEIVKAVERHTGLPENRIEPWRKLGENGWAEILILLRNPYGKKRGCEVKGNLEYRLHRVIRMANKYIDDPEESKLVDKTMPEKTRNALEAYFYGEDGMRMRFEEGLKRIEKGEKPFFLNEKSIFEKSSWDSSASDAHLEGQRVSDDEVRRIVESEVKRILVERGL